VVVVDDHLLIGRLVVGLLERAGYSAAHAYAAATEETWDLVAGLSPQVLLLDFDLGPFHDARVILERAVKADIIVAGFTASDDRLERASFLEMGASVVVGKDCGPADLVAVVELALAGEELMSADERHSALTRLRKYRARRRKTTARFELLTRREQETLRLITEGHGASEIAGMWNVSLPTVRSHIRAVLAKLDVSSQLRAAAMARDTGWYEDQWIAPESSILTMPKIFETGTIARRSGSQG
jgi:DNA-binding NarL/FixJ family response regulator